MADLSARNFGVNGIFIILLLLAGLLLFGFLMYLAWHQENPWPTSKYSRQMTAPPMPKAPVFAPAILFGRPPIQPATSRVARL